MVVEDAVLLPDVVDLRKESVEMLVDEEAFGQHAVARCLHLTVHHPHVVGTVPLILPNWIGSAQVVDVLLEDSPDYQGDTGEEEVIEGNVPILEDGLP